MNAHFSDDILSALLNEPIPGHGVFWSSAAGKSYPIPLRVLSFEQTYKTHDATYSLPKARTFAEELKKRFRAAISASRVDAPMTVNQPRDKSSGQAELFDGEAEEDSGVDEAADSPEDVLATYTRAAIKRVSGDKQFIDRIRSTGIPWKGISVALEEALPDVLDDRSGIAFNLVSQFLTETFGERGKGWNTEKRPKKSGSGMTTWVIVK